MSLQTSLYSYVNHLVTKAELKTKALVDHPDAETPQGWTCAAERGEGRARASAHQCPEPRVLFLSPECPPVPLRGRTGRPRLPQGPSVTKPSPACIQADICASVTKILPPGRVSACVPVLVAAVHLPGVFPAH